jgi:hypothetical protein
MSRSTLLVLALTLTPGLAAAQSQGGSTFTVHSANQDLLPLEVVAATLVDGPDLAAVAAEDLQRELDGLPPRFAIPHAVSIDPSSHGTWENVDAEHLIWRLRVVAPGAANLNLGFGSYWMPPGGELFVYSADLGHVVRPFTAADNETHGQLWTPAVATDDLVIELYVPAAEAEQVKLELTQIGYGYRGFDALPLPTSLQVISGSCNVDVICPEGDPWRLEIPAIGVISVGGGTFCSGFMVNNVRQDYTPYFMTANHCGIGGGNAASLVVYWNYENSFCRPPGSPQSGQSGNGVKNQFNTGSFFRASYSASDFTLVELDDDPDPSFDLSWAGWDATGADAQNATAIHHPQTQEKRISFEFQPTTTTSYLGNSVPGNGTHVRVIDWDLGTTEGGSSGSPLFNQDHRIIGQLHGGFASCSSQTSDWYGKFSVSWTGGGGNNNSLRTWLDPDNTGALTVNTIAASCAAPTTVFSNGSGVNPPCLASVTSPAIGTAWQVGIDTSIVPGATFSALRLYPQPNSGVFGGAGEILVNLSTEYLAASNLPASGGLDVHTINIPNNFGLVGTTLYVQGGVGTGSGLSTLCNSEAVTLGCAP